VALANISAAACERRHDRGDSLNGRSGCLSFRRGVVGVHRGIAGRRGGGGLEEV